MIENSQTLVLVNGKECQTISVHDRGLSYGDGIFETIAIHDGIPLLWDLHWQRFAKGCARLSLKLADKTILEKEVLLLAKKINKGVVKLTLTRGCGKRGYKPDLTQENTRIINAIPASQDKKTAKNVEICISQYVLYPDPQLAGIKHLNRLPQVMASIDQQNDDKIGILCDNNKNIIEAVSANIFIVCNGMLYTPDLTECGVAGVMRENILRQAKKLNINVKIEKLNLSRLQNAEEVFLTNSIIGMLPVHKFIDTTFGSSFLTEFGENSITGKLMSAIGQNKYYN